MTTLVLATLIKAMLASNHCTRNFNSLLTTLFICLIKSLIFKRQVSSTKSNAAECFIAMLRTLMKIKKSKRSRTEPCGTLCFIVYNHILKHS